MYWILLLWDVTVICFVYDYHIFCCFAPRERRTWWIRRSTPGGLLSKHTLTFAVCQPFKLKHMSVHRWITYGGKRSKESLKCELLTYVSSWRPVTITCFCCWSLSESFNIEFLPHESIPKFVFVYFFLHITAAQHAERLFKSEKQTLLS